MVIGVVIGRKLWLWPVKVKVNTYSCRREIERSAETRPATICNTITITTPSKYSIIITIHKCYRVATSVSNSIDVQNRFILA